MAVLDEINNQVSDPPYFEVGVVDAQVSGNARV